MRFIFLALAIVMAIGPPDYDPPDLVDVTTIGMQEVELPDIWPGDLGLLIYCRPCEDITRHDAGELAYLHLAQARSSLKRFDVLVDRWQLGALAGDTLHRA